MVNYARIQQKVDKGLGIAGKHLGPPFTAYRVGAGSSGDFPGGWELLQQNVPVYKERINGTKLDLPLAGSESIWWELFGGMQDFLLGDVFVSSDPSYVPGISYGPGATSIPGTLEFIGFSLALHASAAIPIGGRLDRRVQVYRPSSAPATQGDGTLYFESTKDNDMPLVLLDGSFSWGTAGGVGSFVPCGFASMERPITTPLIKPETPGVPYMMRYYGYLPWLPGYFPTEGDAIIAEDGSRYLVVHPYSQNTGVTGNQLLLNREISQVL